MKKMRKMRLFQKDAYIGIDFLNKKTEIIKLKSPRIWTLFPLTSIRHMAKKRLP